MVTIMENILKAKIAAEKLQQLYPNAECSLNYSSPLEILIAVRLSAQCTDVRVNMVTPELFRRFTSLEDFANANPEEISEIMDTSRDKLADVLSISSKTLSMDAPLISDEDISLIDVYVDDNAEGTDVNVMQESLAKEIHRSLSVLSKKEREIVSLYFGIGQAHGYTLDEIAVHVNLTRERVRQIKDRAIKHLKQTAKTEQLQSYL